MEKYIQKIAGIIVIILAVITAMICTEFFSGQDEGGAVPVLLLIGFYLLFTKEKILTFPAHGKTAGAEKNK